MDYTQNLNLPQWEKTDRIHHDDFNTAFAKIDAAMPHIAVGSYVGTGEYGEDHPTALTFDFAPQLVLITAENRYYTLYLRRDNSFLDFGSAMVVDPQTRWEDNSLLLWYYGGSNIQRNSGGVTYHYYALG